MSLISQAGIVDGQIVFAENVLRIIRALSGESSNEVLITGTLQTTGSFTVFGTASFYGESVRISSSLLVHTASITNNESLTRIIVQDENTGRFHYRNVSSISGSSGGAVDTGSLAITGSNIFKGNQTILGSLIMSGSITGSLLGTASLAQSSSYSELNRSSSFSQLARSASFAESASFTQLARSSSYSDFSRSSSFTELARSSSFALSASFTQLARSSSYSELARSASYIKIAETASFPVPGGSDKYIQYNNNGKLDGNVRLRFNSSTLHVEDMEMLPIAAGSSVFNVQNHVSSSIFSISSLDNGNLGIYWVLGGDSPGDMYFRSGSNYLARLGIGNDQDVLITSGSRPIWTNKVASASFASTASHALNSNSTTASYALTASFLQGSIASASYALSASYFPNVSIKPITSSNYSVLQSDKNLILFFLSSATTSVTLSLNLEPNLQFSAVNSGSGIIKFYVSGTFEGVDSTMYLQNTAASFLYKGGNVWAGWGALGTGSASSISGSSVTASYALTASFLQGSVTSASFATNARSSSYSELARSSSFSTSGSFSQNTRSSSYSDFSRSSSFAVSASFTQTARSASYALNGIQNDIPSPGNDYYYGTDNLGNKGWYPFIASRVISASYALSSSDRNYVFYVSSSNNILITLPTASFNPNWQASFIKSGSGNIIFTGSGQFKNVFGDNIVYTQDAIVTTLFKTGSIWYGLGQFGSSSVSASYALTASYLQGSIDSASFAATASFLQGSVTSASFALSASYFPNTLTRNISSSTYVVSQSDKNYILYLSSSAVVSLSANLERNMQVSVVNSGSGTITIYVSGTLEAIDNKMFSQNTAATFYHKGNNIWSGWGALGTGSASSGSSSESASFAENSRSSSFSELARSSSFTTSGSFAQNARSSSYSDFNRSSSFSELARSASFATSGSFSQLARSSSFALTASSLQGFVTSASFAASASYFPNLVSKSIQTAHYVVSQSDKNSIIFFSSSAVVSLSMNLEKNFQFVAVNSGSGTLTFYVSGTLEAIDNRIYQRNEAASFYFKGNNTWSGWGALGSSSIDEATTASFALTASYLQGSIASASFAESASSLRGVLFESSSYIKLEPAFGKTYGQIGINTQEESDNRSIILSGFGPEGATNKNRGASIFLAGVNQSGNPGQIVIRGGSSGSVTGSVFISESILNINVSRMIAPWYHGMGAGSNLYWGDSAGVLVREGIGGNIGIGNAVLNSLTTGSENIALGRSAGDDLTIGNFNILLGLAAGSSLTRGVDNICIGRQAGDDNISGSDNIFIGLQAGNSNLGSYNVCIGYNAQNPSASGNGQLSIQNAIFGNGNLEGGLGISDGNLGLYTTLHANGQRITSIGNGIGPTSSISDGIQLYATNSTDNMSTLGLYLSQSVETVGTFTASHKLKININGSDYWIQLDKV